MVKRYRAYDEETDQWRHFKIIADENGWEIHHTFGVLGDKCDKSPEENHEIAYYNLQQLLERFHLTKLTYLGED